ncbi:MAG: Holliday junction resolvase RuvX [Phormidesmis priestleyi]|uniref:Putative pre-16S rRNA nuclease n=1 Tax=Phormidesmis priestleyi TaxID=268141 RepID=A0A2W4XQS6_9CYAN|nr:MAG: Holliday junction resolvase RuvX [Phormidesmis priestleyi]
MVSALGLDLGAKRIGVAGCDRTGLIATGLTTLHRTSFDSILVPLRQLINERSVDILVVGLPYTMDGQIGTQAKKIQKLARRLSVTLDLPVEFVDERLTSFAAEQLLQAADPAAISKSDRHRRRHQPNNKSGIIDRKAAAIILQQWLDDRPTLAASNPLC